MVSDKAIAATDIEDAGLWWYYLGYLSGHVEGAPNRAAAPLASPAPLKSFKERCDFGGVRRVLSYRRFWKRK